MSAIRNHATCSQYSQTENQDQSQNGLSQEFENVRVVTESDSRERSESQQQPRKEQKREVENDRVVTGSDCRVRENN